MNIITKETIDKVLPQAADFMILDHLYTVKGELDSLEDVENNTDPSRIMVTFDAMSKVWDVDSLQPFVYIYMDNYVRSLVKELPEDEQNEEFRICKFYYRMIILAFEEQGIIMHKLTYDDVASYTDENKDILKQFLDTMDVAQLKKNIGQTHIIDYFLWVSSDQPHTAHSGTANTLLVMLSVLFFLTKAIVN